MHGLKRPELDARDLTSLSPLYHCTTEEGTFYPKEHISEDIWNHRQKYQHPSAGDVSPAPKFGGLCDELLETDCNVSEADSLLQPLYW